MFKYFFELVQDSWFSKWIYATIDFALLVKEHAWLWMSNIESQGKPLGWRYDLYVINQPMKQPSPKKLSPAYPQNQQICGHLPSIKSASSHLWWGQIVAWSMSNNSNMTNLVTRDFSTRQWADRKTGCKCVLSLYVEINSWKPSKEGEWELGRSTCLCKHGTRHPCQKAEHCCKCL